MTKKRATPAAGPHELKSLVIDSIAACPAPAMEGAVARIIKSRSPEPEGEKVAVAKRAALTSSEDGHSHRIKLDWGEGETTSGNTDSSTGAKSSWHSHPWVMDASGEITIGESAGHSHSMATVSKRAYSKGERDEKAKAGEAMEDGSFPIADKADLKNAIGAFGRAKDKAKAAKHIAKRARALDADSMLPTDGELAELVSKSAGDEAGGDLHMATDAKDDVIKTLEAKNAELTKAADRSAKVLKLSSEERGIFDTLKGADADAFLDDANVRKSRVDAARAGETVVYKSQRTGAVFTLKDDARMVAQVKAMDEDAAALAKSRAIQEEAVLKTRAEELKTFGGTPAVRMALLKAVDTIADEPTRGEVMKLLKARSEFIKGLGVAPGTSAGGGADDAKDAESQLKSLATERVTKSKGTPAPLTFAEAYDQVLGTPEGARLAKRAEAEQRAKFAAAEIGDEAVTAS